MSEAAARKYDPIAVSAESTVVAEYSPEPSTETAYQSEAELEREFIKLLQSQAYEYLPVTSEDELIANLRRQLEILNNMQFSEDEWKQFFGTCIAGKNEGIVDKTVRIQEDHVQNLRRDDGSVKNIKLIDKKNIHNNRLQVINQYEVAGITDGGTAKYSNRYDVTVLVNGLPLVHIELKRRGVDIREAFNQINRYQRHSFGADSGLFKYVQLFVISNGTLTKYYSNTTRERHINETTSTKAVKRKTSNSYEFTSWWADAANRPIQDLRAFTKTFFAKHTILNILTKYCVLTAEKSLMVMRPYQIVATERIFQKIVISTNYKQLGKREAGGYVWHTTGSGKTLTSFKTAQLATQLPDVEKVLFVVDRKDLDYQTMREYDRFQKGAANSNASTAELKRQLENPNAKIIITTIQKLANFVKGNSKHPVYSQHVVIVFDECHRSQFGDMHAAITKAFKRYNLFGFTGTPIFAVNAGSGGKPGMKTTEEAFGEKLHTYTIVDAITDKNVLPFRIDYINTIEMGSDVDEKQIAGADYERVMLDPRRISAVVTYIREHFDQKTKRDRGGSYDHNMVVNVAEVVKNRRNQRKVEEIQVSKRVHGFNALFATASIDAARRYYNEFSVQQLDAAPGKKLKVGLIYSYGANDDPEDSTLGEESFDTSALSVDARSFLEDAIQDYNGMFGTSYDTSSESFQNYYKDLSQRMKNREIDLVIVVNMFLTGFDATTLNTLFVDKNLRTHGLIQAYSRTNRILNSVKSYGNIVSFRNLEDETNAALELFGNKDARGIVLLKPYQDYYSAYVEKTGELLEKFPNGQPIVGESAEKEFIALWGAILRLENILSAFDEFAGQAALSPREIQEYQSRYLDLHRAYRERKEGEKEIINDDVVFEIELVKQVEINVDYILMLVQKYQEEHGTGEDKEIRAEISRAVSASPTLRNKRDLVEEFVDSVSLSGDVDSEWERYVAQKKEAELAGIIGSERLKEAAARRFVDGAFRDGALDTSGAVISAIMPAMSRFARRRAQAGAGQGAGGSDGSRGGRAGADGGAGGAPQGVGAGPRAGESRAEKKQRVIQRLTEFFDRFAGLGGASDE